MTNDHILADSRSASIHEPLRQSFIAILVTFPIKMCAVFGLPAQLLPGRWLKHRRWLGDCTRWETCFAKRRTNRNVQYPIGCNGCFLGELRAQWERKDQGEKTIVEFKWIQMIYLEGCKNCLIEGNLSLWVAYRCMVSTDWCIVAGSRIDAMQSVDCLHPPIRWLTTSSVQPLWLGGRGGGIRGDHCCILHHRVLDISVVVAWG